MGPLTKSAQFQRQANTRLKSVKSSFPTSSTIHCTVICLTTNGCMAAGVTIADDVMTCNIATRLSGPDDLTQDPGSYIYFQNIALMGMYHYFIIFWSLLAVFLTFVNVAWRMCTLS